MFEKWKKKSKQEEKTTHKSDTPNITVDKVGKHLTMIIHNRVSLYSFLDELDKIDPEDKKTILKIPLGVLTDNHQRVKNGKYFWIQKDNKTYFIVLNEEMCEIDEKIVLDDTIEERNFSFTFTDNTFQIGKLLHDKNYSTIGHKHFDSSCNQEFVDEDLACFVLSAADAKKEIDELFQNLKSLENDYSNQDEVLKIDAMRWIINCYYQLLENNQADQIDKLISGYRVHF